MNMLARGMKKHTIRPGSWFLTYTFWYLLFACGVYIIFTLNGRTLIWSTDGIRQVYTTMSYISEHIRTFIATGRLTFDMMDFSLGQGMDVLSSMCFYGLTDPINLLSALTTGDGMEFMYAVAIACVSILRCGVCLYLRTRFKSVGWATQLRQKYMLLQVICFSLRSDTSLRQRRFISPLYCLASKSF